MPRRTSLKDCLEQLREGMETVVTEMASGGLVDENTLNQVRIQMTSLFNELTALSSTVQQKTRTAGNPASGAGLPGQHGSSAQSGAGGGGLKRTGAQAAVPSEVAEAKMDAT